MIPYFSFIDTPISLILVICGLLGSCAVSVIGFTSYNPSNKNILLGIIYGAVLYIVLTWICNGDSFEWSRSFGLWLQGK